MFPGRFCVMFHHAGTRPLLSGSVGNIKGCMHLVCNYLLMGCQDSKLLSKALFFSQDVIHLSEGLMLWLLDVCSGVVSYIRLETGAY